MVKPYQNSPLSKKEQVTTMFDGIADNYDSLNRVISMGIDKSWRRKLVAMAANKKPETIVDVATGTGFLFSSSDYVITSYHVVHGAKSIRVRLINGERIDATVALWSRVSP